MVPRFAIGVGEPRKVDGTECSGYMYYKLGNRSSDFTSQWTLCSVQDFRDKIKDWLILLQEQTFLPEIPKIENNLTSEFKWIWESRMVLWQEAQYCDFKVWTKLHVEWANPPNKWMHKTVV